MVHQENEEPSSSGAFVAWIEEDDGEAMDMEVGGQCTEFLSEEEDSQHEMDTEQESIVERETGELSREDSEADDEVEFARTNSRERRSSQSQNNNARIESEILQSQDMTALKERTERTVADIDAEEEAFFDRFHKYMERKGIIKMDQGKGHKTKRKEPVNDRRKENTRGKKTHNIDLGLQQLKNFRNFQQSPSEVTIYCPAVHRADEEIEFNLKRISSSSDEDDIIDTSGENRLSDNDHLITEVKQGRYVLDDQEPLTS